MIDEKWFWLWYIHTINLSKDVQETLVQEMALTQRVCTGNHVSMVPIAVGKIVRTMSYTWIRSLTIFPLLRQ